MRVETAPPTARRPPHIRLAADGIPSAASYLRALLRRADGNLSQAILGYNHAEAYVTDVLARARAYARQSDSEAAAPDGESTVVSDCAESGPTGPAGPANLRQAQRVTSPRGFRMLPAWALAGGGPGAVDARLYGDVLWILRRYHLRVSAARAAGQNTHGDGTAVDLIPADGPTQAIWDASAGRPARPRPRLDWRLRALWHAPALPPRARQPVHRLRRLPGHGSPRTCTGGCPPHLHLSWGSPCYGTSRLSAPCEWVMAFAVLPTDYPAAARPAP